MSSRRQPQTAITVGSADEIGKIVIRSGQRFVKRHPAISVAWVVGLFVSILASGYTPTPQAVQNYEVRVARSRQIKRVPKATRHADATSRLVVYDRNMQYSFFARFLVRVSRVSIERHILPFPPSAGLALPVYQVKNNVMKVL